MSSTFPQIELIKIVLRISFIFRVINIFYSKKNVIIRMKFQRTVKFKYS